jgi:hypothetical protein
LAIFKYKIATFLRRFIFYKEVKKLFEYPFIIKNIKYIKAWGKTLLNFTSAVHKVQGPSPFQTFLLPAST